MSTKVRNLLIAAAVIVGVPVVGAVFVFSAGALYLGTAKELPVGDAERAVVLTASDIAAYYDKLTPVETAEKLTKSRFFDGAHAVEYEYEHPNDSAVLYLSSSLNLEKSTTDAKSTYAGSHLAVGAGFLAQGDTVKQIDKPELFHWGDESRSMMLMSGESPVGHYVLARKGKLVFSVMFVGLYFDEPGQLQGLLDEKLEAVETYAP